MGSQGRCPEHCTHRTRKGVCLRMCAGSVPLHLISVQIWSHLCFQIICSSPHLPFLTEGPISLSCETCLLPSRERTEGSEDWSSLHHGNNSLCQQMSLLNTALLQPIRANSLLYVPSANSTAKQRPGTSSTSIVGGCSSTRPLWHAVL